MTGSAGQRRLSGDLASERSVCVLERLGLDIAGALKLSQLTFPDPPVDWGNLLTGQNGGALAGGRRSGYPEMLKDVAAERRTGEVWAGREVGPQPATEPTSASCNTDVHRSSVPVSRRTHLAQAAATSG